MNRFFLIGFMGSGKSTLGREVAESLKFTFMETDSIIEQREQRPIQEIFKSNGEEYFRQKETEVLNHLQLVDHCVIATGGGMPCCHHNMNILNQLGITIWLDVDENILVERLKNETSDRPKLMDSMHLEKTIHDLLASRTEFYRQAKFNVRNPDINALKKLINDNVRLT